MKSILFFIYFETPLTCWYLLGMQRYTWILTAYLNERLYSRSLARIFLSTSLKEEKKILTCSYQCVGRACSFHWADQQETRHKRVFIHIIWNPEHSTCCWIILWGISFLTQGCFIPVFAYVSSSLLHFLALKNMKYSNLTTESTEEVKQQPNEFMKTGF